MFTRSFVCFMQREKQCYSRCTHNIHIRSFTLDTTHTHTHVHSQWCGCLCTGCCPHLVKASGAAGLNRPVSRKREGCGGEWNIPLKWIYFVSFLHCFHCSTPLSLTNDDVCLVCGMCGLYSYTFIRLLPQWVQSKNRRYLHTSWMYGFNLWWIVGDTDNKD